MRITLLMILRFQFVPMVAGFFMSVIALYGLATYVPTPDSSPFATPPYDIFFAFGIVFGVGAMVYAYIKTPKL